MLYIRLFEKRYAVGRATATSTTTSAIVACVSCLMYGQAPRRCRWNVHFHSDPDITKRFDIAFKSITLCFLWKIHTIHFSAVFTGILMVGRLCIIPICRAYTILMHSFEIGCVHTVSCIGTVCSKHKYICAYSTIFCAQIPLL